MRAQACGVCDADPARNGEVARRVGFACFGTVGLLVLALQVAFWSISRLAHSATLHSHDGQISPRPRRPGHGGRELD
jgi:hypothetical protein